MYAYCPFSKVEEQAIVQPAVIVEEIPEPEPTKNAVVEMQLADWCGPCRKFKASGIIRELKAKGWTIKYTTDIGKKYPSFRVWVRGKSEEFTGYSSKSSFYKRLNSIVKKLKDK